MTANAVKKPMDITIRYLPRLPAYGEANMRETKTGLLFLTSID